jgi:hypothetical protein
VVFDDEDASAFLIARRPLAGRRQLRSGDPHTLKTIPAG